MNKLVEAGYPPKDGTSAAPEVAPTSLTPADMVQFAMKVGSIELADKALALYERWQASQNRRAFEAAMSDAKGEMPTIFKNRQVKFPSARGGSDTQYKYEDLASIEAAVRPVLSAHGLDYRFRTSDTPDRVTVTCILSHRDGHIEENSLSSPHDKSGNKNAIQALGSAVTYLSRYTLKAALGLAVSNDDDGQAAGNGKAEPEQVVPVPAIISYEQAEALAIEIEKTGVTETFLKAYNIKSIHELRADEYDMALARLRNYSSKAKSAGKKS